MRILFNINLIRIKHTIPRKLTICGESKLHYDTNIYSQYLKSSCKVMSLQAPNHIALSSFSERYLRGMNTALYYSARIFATSYS